MSDRAAGHYGSAERTNKSREEIEEMWDDLDVDLDDDTMEALIGDDEDHG